jgi:hypothetical protein
LRFPSSKACALSLRECGLTPRSSEAPTAGRQARSGGTRYIFARPGLASCRRRPLSSNVRPFTFPCGHSTCVSNQGWVGEVIGVIGVGFGIYHFLHRAGPKFSYQS